MLTNIRRALSNFGSGKLITILVVSAILLGISFWVYRTYITPRLNPIYIDNKEIATGEPEKEAQLFFFYTTWCPHCKNARPEWEKLKEEYEGKPINNTRVFFRDVDCDKEEEVADQYKVDGYPTIKLVKDGQIVEYDAKPNYQTLVEFLHTTL